MLRVTSSFVSHILVLCGFATLHVGCRSEHSNEPPTSTLLIESQPLARAGSSNNLSTMFELLPTQQTGVDFTVTWDKPAKYDRVFYSQNTGGGVCIGDYDGDQRPDIYLTSPSGGNRLFRNLGDFRFQDVTAQAGLLDREHWGMGATLVDIDNDADLDIYVCGYDCRNTLYINRGDGTFEESAGAYGLDFHGASVMMAFADYDRDGDLDGYLLTAGIPPGPGQEFKVRFEGNRPVIPDHLKEHWQLLYFPGERAKQVEAGQYDHLYRNNGDGTFTEVTHEAGIDGPEFGQSAQWWDYDHDGWPDLYVANDYWGADHLYRNNGDGTFTDVAKTALPHTPWSSMGADIVDLNNDGLFDLMATDMSSTTHFKQKVSMGDMSGGWFLEYPEPRQYMRNAVYLNTATSRFMEIGYLTGLADTDWTWTPRFDDFDNDGWVDLFVTNGMTRDFTNSDLNEQAKRFAKEGSPEFFRFWRRQPLRKDQNLAFKNLGDFQFADVGRQWGLDRLGVSFGAATGDLDGDGNLDLVVNNMDTTTSIYRNHCTSGNRVKVRLRGTISNRLGIGAVVRIETMAGQQVRYLTLARGWTSCAEPVLHFGLADSSRIAELTVEWPSGHQQRFEDLAVNRFYTITEPSHKPSAKQPSPRQPTRFVRSELFQGVVHQEQPFDDFRRQPLLPNKLSQLGPGMAWGDVDGDGDEDMYLSGAKGYKGRLFVREASGQFQDNRQAVFGPDNAEQMAPLFFDADADGDLDLYVVSGGVECDPGDESLADQLYLNDGHGRFSTAPPGTLPPVRDSGSVVVGADFDRDGDLDLFVGSRSVPGQYPRTPQSRLLRNDTRQFTDVTDQIAPGLRLTGLVTAALWSDVDADGWIDLLVTHEWGPVKLYRNQQGRLRDRTGQAGLAQRLGWWNGIAGGDLDHDGDIDYVVTNFGLNTKYHPSPDKPVRIYYGEFDGSGRKQIIEAKVAQEGILPVRGKSCSQNAIPMLSEKFPTYRSFALASLSDIYTTECLDACLQLEVNTLDSGVLLNDGQGRFTFQPLPRLAQASPGFGVAVTDVDGDGNPDIYLVQNFYGPQRETGRMDGGVSLLLRGNGDGTFTVSWPSESGLLVPGDAKSLTVTDLNQDARPDFVVSVNDGPIMAFEQRALEDRRPIGVRLNGHAGNVHAAGARVTVTFRDGSSQTAEVYAGSGYLSQSSRVIYFGSRKGQVVERIGVVWPDGGSTSHTTSLSLPIVEITQP